jgi:ferric-dicitrate binding protein FerR (iron transport regulator)
VRRPVAEVVLRAPVQRPRCRSRGRDRRTVNALRLDGATRSVRARGGAAWVRPRRSATVELRDRCDGTWIRVRGGRAQVRDQRRQRTLDLAPGRVYLARAQLFQARTEARP